MNDSAALILTALVFGAGLAFWPVIKHRVLRPRTPDAQWRRAEEALQRIWDRREQ